ncbi:MAG: DUF3048 domain-containing protein [Chloroflexi bacterium]|nr:DUF3048 domain-containing protein [Chloroflexota bacterium]
MKVAVAVLLASLVAAACGGSGTLTPSTAPTQAQGSPAAAQRATSPTVAATPTATPKPVIWPLTGMVATDPSAVKRRPLNVRMPNDPSGRPQVGLAKADLSSSR